MDRQVRRAPHSPHCIEHVIQTPAASNVTRRRAEAVSHGRRRMPMRGAFFACCASAANGASTKLRTRTTARPINRMGTSVEDGCRGV